MNLHPLELRWLITQGDRKSSDVLIDEVGEKFIYMFTPDGPKRVYLPSLEYLIKKVWIAEIWNPVKLLAKKRRVDNRKKRLQNILPPVYNSFDVKKDS